MTQALDLFDEFATDESKEVDGVYVEYSADVEFLIARSDNKEFSRVFSKLYARNKRVIEQKPSTPAAEAKGDEVMIEAMAAGILRGWRGKFKFKGEDLPYSVDNAKKLLAMKEFRRWVMTQANDETLYKLAEDEADEKN